MTKLIAAYKTFPEDIKQDALSLLKDLLAAAALVTFITALTIALPDIASLFN